MNKRDFLAGVTVVGATFTMPEEAMAATYVVPPGKSEAKVTWYDENGEVQYTTTLDVKPGHKFRITSK